MNLLTRFLRLSHAERALLLEAVVGLTAAGVLLRLFAFRRLAPRLGQHQAESPTVSDPASIAAADRIREAIDIAARRLPWKPVCLPQAVSAQWMLRRRGIASTLYLGINPSSDYDAHAWVRAGRMIVTGGPRPEGFVVVSTFA